MANKYNCVLVDFDYQKENSDFVKILENTTSCKWVINQKVTNHLHGGILKNIIRFIIYFIYPLKILRKRKKIDKIIGWQQFYGLNYAFWCRTFRLEKVNDLTIMTFIYKKKSGVIGFLYHKYMQYIVTSKYIDRFICFAKEECSYYSDLFGIAKDKFVFIQLGEGDLRTRNADICDNGYLFATGRSNRNYDFIIDILANTPYKLIIACDDYKRHNLPQNIAVLSDCYGDDMLSMMAKCHCVVVPLKDLTMSSGQLVVLQAMSMGKPVICTKSYGIRDYIINEETGLLVDNNRHDWLDALSCLDDKKIWSFISKRSLAVYKYNFTQHAMYKRIANLYI